MVTFKCNSLQPLILGWERGRRDHGANKSLLLNLCGEHLTFVIVDFGGSDFEYLSGLAMNVDHLSFITYALATAKVLSAHYPLSSKRVIFVRSPPAFQTSAWRMTTAIDLSWITTRLRVFTGTALALDYLLTLMHPEVVPACLGGTDGKSLASSQCSGRLRPCLAGALPWTRRHGKRVLWQPGKPGSGLSAGEQSQVDALTRHFAMSSSNAYEGTGLQIPCFGGKEAVGVSEASLDGEHWASNDRDAAEALQHIDKLLKQL